MLRSAQRETVGPAQAAIAEIEATLLRDAHELGSVSRRAGGINQHHRELPLRDDTDVRVEVIRTVDEQPPPRLLAHSHDPRRPARVRRDYLGGVAHHDHVQPIDRLNAPAERAHHLDSASTRLQMIADGLALLRCVRECHLRPAGRERVNTFQQESLRFLAEAVHAAHAPSLACCTQLRESLDAECIVHRLDPRAGEHVRTARPCRADISAADAPAFRCCRCA
jgi:hypothetical protein